ncbi:molybdopterin cofactor-binding domain-containing protein [Polaromonas sp.]|uniref:molybdopterin cofactor-binding domain-containing protein n=1 Tax=Polaromonas sp. TaxID=1869339 RepID=UPI001DB335A3|nr:molybdopterin cofactor-binding domain-containing protein [Polaromonas sp.]MBT9476383.1 xanthine dehydrogenase family protein molybdopterin-binding subunit [Polaromonas sp.]
MSAPLLAANLKNHPRLGQWLDVGPDGKILAFSGKVDIGQGILHALRLIVAEELQLHPDEVVMVRATTMRSPDEAVTSGSLSVQDSGTALRHAAAHLREACRSRHAGKHGVSPSAIELSDGVFTDPQHMHSASYLALVDAAMLATTIDPGHLETRQHQHHVGGHYPRPDIQDKVFGQFEFINDLVLPDMVFGQVFRPNTLTAQLNASRAAQLAQALSGLQGVIKVVRDGLLIGVLADAERVLARAAEKVARAQVWTDAAGVPPVDGVTAWLKSQPLASTVVLDQPAATPKATPLQMVSADYERPYLHHASIGLSCAIAQSKGATLQVWSHSQGIFNLRRDLALAFGMDPESVMVSHCDAAGCYGHNGADDVAFDASWLARQASGRPVRVQWSRHAEMAHAPMGPAMAVRLEAGLDDAGNLLSWTQEVWSQGHGTRPGREKTPALLGAWQTADPFPVTMAVNAALSVGGGSERNAVPPYAIAGVKVLNHRVLSMPLRVSALRALGAHANVFAAESFMDELAERHGRDPLAFRLAHLEDERARAVLREAARLAGWDEPAALQGGDGSGRGIGYARYKNTGAYCAVVVELVVEEAVRLSKLYIAADLGLVIHPDGARNQIEGGAIQAASWSLCESARFGPEGVHSVDWASYPIFQFGDVPEVEISLMDRPDCPALGAGECTTGPTAAAIANAIHHATGLRIRSMPFSADKLMQLAQAS